GPAPEPAAPVPVGPGEPGTLFRPAGTEPLPKVNWVDTPGWFRKAGGLYCPAPRTAGSSLLLFTENAKWALSNRIKHFRELPTLLDQAKQLGTNVIYLVDYYEGRSDLAPEEYCWNKGEYEARADLGGAEGLKEGIRLVHAQGGKVLLYLEPFVFQKSAPIAQKHGQDWSIRTKDGYPDDPYPDAWKLCPANKEFVKYLVGVAGKLVGEYGADGLHLDSYGYQRDWKCVEASHGHGATPDPEVFNGGAKALVEALYTEIKRHDPSAVLMCEGPRVAGLFRWVSASQDWGINALSDRWIWKAPGHVPVFTSGWSLDDLNQIVALGHRLTLGANYWFEAPPAPTLTGWFADHLPDPLPDKKDERFRRFFGEDCFRVIHQFRNAGLLLGAPMPNVDHAAPRRWDRGDAFGSFQGLTGIIDEGKQLGVRIDAALAGKTLPAPTAYVKTLVQAREAFAPAVDGASITPLPPPSATSGAYRFDGPAGVSFSAVNVDESGVDVGLPGAKG
ncbi:MAG: DUF6259 domain-containing protein, partial [Myxococcota bacterium]